VADLGCVTCLESSLANSGVSLFCFFSDVPRKSNSRQNAFDFEESKAEGQRDAHTDAVSQAQPSGTNHLTDCGLCSGLDNAGKTTIVKRIMNEDISTVSPTLGFIIKTIDFEGYDGQWKMYGEIPAKSCH
jgi:hypothetical protein